VENIGSMKMNIFCNWILDIAKYITTAMIISGAFSAIEQGWKYYVASTAIVVFMVVAAFLIMEDKDKPDKKKEKDV
jgi:ABC-type multidrug transport system permease subunit